MFRRLHVKSHRFASLTAAPPQSIVDGKITIVGQGYFSLVPL